MATDDDSERTHDPTPRRREQFYKEGQFARSRDAGPLASTLAVLGVVAALGGAGQHVLEELFARTHGDLGAFAAGRTTEVAHELATSLAALAVPAMLASASAGVAAGLLQTGLRFDVEMIGFKPERLDPLPRLMRLLKGGSGFFEVALSLLRVGVVAYVAARAVAGELPGLLSLADVPPTDALPLVGGALQRVMLRALTALAVLAGLDYLHSRLTLEKQMKMTLREVKDEMRSQDGDPQVKARMRARARALARKRMMGDVKTAAVVVTNPTHVAVALRYATSDGAPVVVAKGHDEAALAIRSQARKFGIPIVENKPLARALDAEVEVGRTIPSAHFAAVAHVLAFVYRLRGGRRPGAKKQ
jgi:flagellar biosynthetic protein FlhB